MGACTACGAGVERILDLGRQPVANRFVSSPEAEEYTHPMVLGQCSRCALVQLVDPVPASELVPLVDWITYNEPEAHLDDLAAELAGLPGLPRDAVFGGVSFKDDTLLDRMGGLGYAHRWRIDPVSDLGITTPGAGVESVEAALDAASAARIVSDRGAADVLVVRHIAEHAHDVRGFCSALESLVRPGGYVVLEVPDCSRSLETRDYSSLWEEHIAYFTASTFRGLVTGLGWQEWSYRVAPYPFEDSLVVVARVGGAADECAFQPPASEFDRAHGFAADWGARRTRWRAALERYGGPEGVCLYGAGHVAVTFVNLLGLEGVVSFVADDDEHKRGLLLAGSRLPVRPSSALYEGRARLCLMCLSPTAEAKVAEIHEAFVERGGVMASAIPASDAALTI